MIKKTFSTVALLALAGCQQQQPAETPQVGGSEPAPVGEAQPAVAAPAPTPPAPPATPEDRAKMVQSCWSMFGAKDWQKFSGCYAESATTEQVDMGFPVATGRNDVVEKHAKQYVAAFPDGNGEPQLTLVNGSNVAVVVLFRGTNSGPLTGPTGTLPATNKKVGYLVGQVADLTDDGRAVAHDRFYVNAAAMLGQLGVNPSPHRKVLEVGAAEKPVVLATNSDIEKVNLAVGTKSVEEFNKHDANALVGLWADDGVFSDQSAPADTVGKQAIKKAMSDFFKGFPDIKLDATKTWAAGDYVVMEGTMSGTNTGDMPSMKLKKTGKKVNLRYLEIAKLQGGKIKNSWVFNNGMAFAMQLGLVPPPGAKDPKATGKDSKPAAAATPAAPASKDAKGAPAGAPGKESKAATPATPAVPGSKPATPATPAAPAKDAKPATPAAPTAPAPTAAKPSAPAAPAAPAGKPAAPAVPAASAKK